MICENMINIKYEMTIIVVYYNILLITYLFQLLLNFFIYIISLTNILVPLETSNVRIVPIKVMFLLSRGFFSCEYCVSYVIFPCQKVSLMSSLFYMPLHVILHKGYY